MLYAEVLLAVPVGESWTYSVPDAQASAIAFGKRVIVPFGKRKMTGYVILVSDQKPEGEYEIRSIDRIVDKEPVFTPEQLRIAKWMHKMYFTATGICLSAMIPSGRGKARWTLSLSLHHSRR